MKTWTQRNCVILICVMLILGCSTTGGSVLTGTPQVMDRIQDHRNTTQTHLWGLYLVEIDPVSLDVAKSASIQHLKLQAF